ncbi:antibiotic biosynthesis monooxygenase [Nocardia sp. NPDC059764]|uniref:antibiotic biosynthesis monooxygenase n=1 Tax=Nocardia sp. NPDC059764 TaxID=3346939 RepID=UPI00365EFE3C
MSQSLVPKTGVDGPVTVIKSYTVPAAEADYFVEAYHENARIMSTQPGSIRSRLHRPLADAAEADSSMWPNGNRASRSAKRPAIPNGVPRGGACSTIPDFTSPRNPRATASSPNAALPEASGRRGRLREMGCAAAESMHLRDRVR